MYKQVENMLQPKSIFNLLFSESLLDVNASQWGNFATITMMTVPEVTQMYQTMIKNSKYLNEQTLTSWTTPTTNTTFIGPPPTNTYGSRDTPIILHNYGFKFTVTNQSTVPVIFETWIVYPIQPVTYSIDPLDPISIMLATKLGQPTNSGGFLQESPFYSTTPNKSDGFANPENRLSEYSMFKRFYKTMRPKQYNIQPGATVDIEYSYAPKRSRVTYHELLYWANQITQVPRMTRNLLVRYRAQKVATDPTPPPNCTSPQPPLCTLQTILSKKWTVQMGWQNATQAFTTSTVAASITAGSGNRNVQEQTGGLTNPSVV